MAMCTTLPADGASPARVCPTCLSHATRIRLGRGKSCRPAALTSPFEVMLPPHMPYCSVYHALCCSTSHGVTIRIASHRVHVASDECSLQRVLLWQSPLHAEPAKYQAAHRSGYLLA